MSGPTERGLWECPRCGAKFVNRNQWHSCGQSTLEDWIAPLGPAGNALYAALEALIARCGEYHVAPAKSRVAFLAQVRFAGITRLRDDEMVFGFALPYKLESPRVRKIKEEVPGWFSHQLRVTDPGELDDEVASWLADSYRLMGMRERLEHDD